MTDKELYDIAIYIKEQATPEELKEFKRLEQHEDRIAWVKNQIAKLDKGQIILVSKESEDK